MLEFIQTITNDELRYISRLDYGEESEEHFAALSRVIFEQNGIITEEQYWYPYEVIELGAAALEEGHEREFVICTLLVVLNVNAGADISTDLEGKFAAKSGEYDQLPEQLSALVLGAFEGAGC